MGVLDRRRREDQDRDDRPGPEQAVAPASPAERPEQRRPGAHQGQGGPGQGLEQDRRAILPPGAADEVLRAGRQPVGHVQGPERDRRREPDRHQDRPGQGQDARQGPPPRVPQGPDRRSVAIPEQDRRDRRARQDRAEAQPLDQRRGPQGREEGPPPERGRGGFGGRVEAEGRGARSPARGPFSPPSPSGEGRGEGPSTDRERPRSDRFRGGERIRRSRRPSPPAPLPGGEGRKTGTAGERPSTAAMRPAGRSAPGSAIRSRSNATIVPVTRQASRISASASRPRRTSQNVVAWISPASHPTFGPNRLEAKDGHAQGQQGRGDRRRGPRDELGHLAGHPARDRHQPEGQRGLLEPGLAVDRRDQHRPARDHLAGRLRDERLVIRQPPRGPQADPQRQGRKPHDRGQPSRPQSSLGHGDRALPGPLQPDRGRDGPPAAGILPQGPIRDEPESLRTSLDRRDDPDHLAGNMLPESPRLHDSRERGGHPWGTTAGRPARPEFERCRGPDADHARLRPERQRLQRRQAERPDRRRRAGAAGRRAIRPIQISTPEISSPAAFNRLVRQIASMSRGRPIGIVGFSAGGSLAARLAGVESLQVKAALDYYGPADLAGLPRPAPGRFVLSLRGRARPLHALGDPPAQRPDPDVGLRGRRLRPRGPERGGLREPWPASQKDVPDGRAYTYPGPHGASINASPPALEDFLAHSDAESEAADAQPRRRCPTDRPGHRLPPSGRHSP